MKHQNYKFRSKREMTSQKKNETVKTRKAENKTKKHKRTQA